MPTPIPLDDRRIYLVTENNNGRIHRFDEKGAIEPEFLSVQKDVGHDSNTSVASGNRIYAAEWALLCLDAGDLHVLWTLEDDALGDYATLILGETRLLAGTHAGIVLLVDIESNPGRIVSRWRLFDEDDVVLSHPAVVNHRLLVRSASKIVCVRLGPDE